MSQEEKNNLPGINFFMTSPFIGAGVKRDLKQLYTKFNDLQSMKLTDYASVFRELRFDTIWNYRISPAEYVEFAEYVLQAAANYFRVRSEKGATRTFPERVFGVFTCYALYNLQPVDYVCQIQVTTQQIGELHAFEQQLSKSEIKDAVTCIHELVKKRAFHICLFQSTYDPMTQKKYLCEEEYIEVDNLTVEPFKGVKSLLASSLFKEIELLHRSYVKGKEKLGIIKSSSIDTKCPVDAIKEILEEHEANFKKTQQQKDNKNQESNDKVESAGTSRANLKSKAYGDKLKHSRNRRYLDPNMDENFKHLTMGKIAESLIDEPSTSKKTSENKGKRQHRKQPQEPQEQQNDTDFQDNHTLAQQVLEESMAGMMSFVKKEIVPENPEKVTENEGKLKNESSKRGKAQKRKANLKSPEKAEEKPITRNEKSDSLESPKKFALGAKKPKLDAEWTTKLKKLKDKQTAADKTLEKLKNIIKLDNDLDVDV